MISQECFMRMSANLAQTSAWTDQILVVKGHCDLTEHVFGRFSTMRMSILTGAGRK